MPISEKKKISNAKWDKENMITLGCKVYREQANKFKEIAAEQGKTSNALLKEYVISTIEKKDD